MTLTRRQVFVAAAGLVTSGALRDAFADDTFVVVVHPENPIREVDRDVLREAFLKKVIEWSSGGRIRPIDLSKRFAVRERFVREIVRKTPAQLKSYWNQQIFSGKGVPPPEADQLSTVIAYVAATRGAVGYLPAGTDARGVKVVKVR